MAASAQTDSRASREGSPLSSLGPSASSERRQHGSIAISIVLYRRRCVQLESIWIVYTTGVRFRSRQSGEETLGGWRTVPTDARRNPDRLTRFSPTRPLLKVHKTVIDDSLFHPQ